MSYFAATQQTIALKLPAIFLSFQIEDSNLRLIKVRLLVNILSMEIILKWKVTMDKVKRKKLCDCFF